MTHSINDESGPHEATPAQVAARFRLLADQYDRWKPDPFYARCEITSVGHEYTERANIVGLKPHRGRGKLAEHEFVPMTYRVSGRRFI